MDCMTKNEIAYIAEYQGMDDCAVCYEKVNETTGHCTLSCKHSFHIACLTRWSAENPSCPMCRHPLGVTEAPAKQLVERDYISWFMDTSRVTILTSTPGQGRQGAMLDLIREAMGPEPVQPLPNHRNLNIGDGVRVSEEDVALVMEQSAVTRGAAVRALRRYEGDIVNSILMLTSPDAVVPRRPVVRDSMQQSSDDQATAWFLQQMFEETGGYHWNSYSDMLFRMRNGTRGHEYSTHSDFNESPGKSDGYNSA